MVSKPPLLAPLYSPSTMENSTKTSLNNSRATKRQTKNTYSFSSVARIPLNSIQKRKVWPLRTPHPLKSCNTW
jgi:L-asparaginase/Glu-tRNA(Gln) amidotransferase subunit D